MSELDDNVEFAKQNAKKYPEFEKEVFQAILISKLIGAKNVSEEKVIAAPDKLQPQKKDVKDNYSGLSGGIRLLIQEKILDSPKSTKEIEDELKRNGYHYPAKSIAKLLSVNFMKKSRILTRIKIDKKWKYCIRK